MWIENLGGFATSRARSGARALGVARDAMTARLTHARCIFFSFTGDIAAVGPDVKGVSVGKTVLYSKFGIGCVDLVVGGEDYVLIKEQDLIGCFPSSGARASDIPKLEPCGDRVLLKVDSVESTTKGGILLTEGAKEKPVTGTVVSAGPGKAGEDGVIKPLTVKTGDKVIYFKYAGDQMTDEEGNAFVVLHENDILARL